MGTVLFAKKCFWPRKKTENLTLENVLIVVDDQALDRKSTRLNSSHNA